MEEDETTIEELGEDMGGEMACQAPRGWWDADEEPEREDADAGPPAEGEDGDGSTENGRSGEP